ncbi:MAG TPA: universal stress protein [Candidatus Micrarchaeaceae archaeon]|nr:universal stress protein [Candidatus Micrarchaeaceae archaeon]
MSAVGVPVTNYQPPAPADPIVVGVDQTVASRHALEWAAAEAESRGMKILAITTFLSRSTLVAGPYPEALLPTPAEVDDDYRASLLEAVGAVSRQYPQVRIEAKAVEGTAAEVLIEVSKHAAELVVGSRGRSALIGLLLGSVSQRCVSEAHCPVVVVGPRARVEQHRPLGFRFNSRVDWTPA